MSCAGFAFDELDAEVVLEAARHAQRAGSAILFDPGEVLLSAQYNRHFLPAQTCIVCLPTA